MGVTYLLDTHVLLWLLGDVNRVPRSVLDEFEDEHTRLLVSAASAMEIATKVRIGKLPDAQQLLSGWVDRLTDIAADELPITPRHALLAGSMPWEHRDPYDRLLAAQAMAENAPLVTADPAMSTLAGLKTRW